MSYTHTHLPKLEDLKKNVESNSDLLRYYSKYGGFIGSSSAIEYLDKQIKEYYDSKKS
jgi:hypothetical protein|tara:strand:+ start:65 stop:238 length:174 start_codon:yes stop_codon:yes gene_type:complete